MIIIHYSKCMGQGTILCPIQEISPKDYNADYDGLPEENTYSDSSAGHTYKYASNGTLTSETNRLGKTTKYFYNDIGTIHCSFDNGRSLGIVPGEDSFRKLTEEELAEEQENDIDENNSPVMGM